MSTMAQVEVEVTAGVDTHKDSHTAAALDAAGRLLGSAQFPATAAGYAGLLAWLAGFGTVMLVGVEGTGVYGAGLARHLRAHGVAVVEVDRPDRKARRWQGKSDPVDAEAAARAALARRATGIPKDRDSRVEALRNLRVARRSAIRHRADAQRQIHALLITAPEPLRAQLSALRMAELLRHAATAVIDIDRADEPAVAVMIALQVLARRHQQLTVEIT
jgi:transposase